MSTKAQRAKWNKDYRDRQKRLAAMDKADLRIAGRTYQTKVKNRQARNADAVIYLRHARAEIDRQVKSGAARVDDPAFLYALLALRCLEGARP